VRIAFTHAFCWPEVRRGAERFIQELGAALVERGHEVTILSAAWEAEDSTLDGVRTVRLRRRRRDGWGHEADFARRVLPHLVGGRYHVVHSMGRRDARASIRAARLHSRRRTVITDLGLPSRAFWSAHPIEARAVEAVVAGIDVYSCMSRYALGYLGRDYGRHDGVVVPGGVDLASFRPAEARHPHPTLLFSGALDEPRKGIATLLEALPLVARAVPDVRLQLSGPGDPAPFLAAAPPEATTRTEVLGAGSAAEQHQRYGRAWATCLPSVSDSFGMALVESLACGTPLVVSTDGAPQELVDDGATGTLCEPFDATSLAAACVRALELARQPATAATCRAGARRFDWRAGVAPWVERLYRDGVPADPADRPYG
jgi:phosphatidyl-myo-inositol alpha-mannosyltransferase